ncbi:MAG: cellulase family glycosylhydrolase [Kiritimatiellae bacterium]|nr:cellulase family glycosylhydrolase [Kiritimatiellia bacterium]
MKQTLNTIAALGAAIIAAAALCAATDANAAAPRWSVEKAKAWGAANPWWCGVNYIPANAINYTAMWDKTSFSPDVIRRELKLMTGLGMNCVRFVMQYKVYEDDPAYFIKTLDIFLALCDEAGVKAMPIFFDDCVFGANADPVIGRQPEPLEGWYAWAWSPSPGHTMVIDEREHPKLEKYVKDVITRFRDDKRIFLWDLYNEPTNSRLGKRSFPLLRKTFAWARDVNPSQPISSGIWNGNKELNKILLENSDVVTFHCYANGENTAARIKEIVKSANGRPVICTEWMNRTVGSTVKDCLHLFKDANVGCIAWGLVNGKTQTHLKWGHRPEMLPYKGPWQHDFYRGDFTPYDVKELETIRAACAGK